LVHIISVSVEFDPAKAREERVLEKRGNAVRDEYDFSKGKRGAVMPRSGKTRITIMIDDDIVEAFKARALSEGTGYQTLMNATLRQALEQPAERPLTVATLRKVLREELKTA